MQKLSGVEVDDLCVDLGEFKTSNVSFSVQPGEMVSLVGPSGCGKSTILKTIAGLLDGVQGRIAIGGQLVSAFPNGPVLPSEKRGVGMVFQSYAIWPHMTVFENVAYPLKVRRWIDDDIKKTVMNMLSVVGLAEMANRPAPLLSGGQQQRVAIARALVFQPKVLLLDEPLSNLDAKLRIQMGFELKRIQKETGVTTIYVTHDQAEALALSDRIVVLDKGRVQQIDTPQRIYEQPASPFVSWFIGLTNLLQGNLATIDPVENEIGHHGSVVIAGGPPVACRIADGALSAGQPIIFSIRPENIHLSAGNELGQRAQIVAAGYFGERWQYTAKIGPTTVIFFAPPTTILALGQDINLTIEPTRGIAFRSVDGASSVYSEPVA